MKGKVNMDIEISILVSSEYSEYWKDAKVYIPEDAIIKLIDKYFELKKKQEILDE